MFRFSNDTLALLSKAGWSEEYRYDTSDYVTLLQSCGYIVHEAALDFMQHFGGLVITYPHPRVPNAIETMTLSVDYGPDNRFNETARWASEILGVEVCDIGIFHTRDYYLVMDASGVVYGVGDIRCRLGKSGEEAIENICSGDYGEDLLLSAEDIV